MAAVVIRKGTDAGGSLTSRTFADEHEAERAAAAWRAAGHEVEVIHTAPWRSGWRRTVRRILGARS